jgi:hypothetical protein
MALKNVVRVNSATKQNSQILSSIAVYTGDQICKKQNKKEWWILDKFPLFFTFVTLFICTHYKFHDTVVLEDRLIVQLLTSWPQLLSLRKPWIRFVDSWLEQRDLVKMSREKTMASQQQTTRHVRSLGWLIGGPQGLSSTRGTQGSPQRLSGIYDNLDIQCFVNTNTMLWEFEYTPLSNVIIEYTIDARIKKNRVWGKICHFCVQGTVKTEELYQSATKGDTYA